MNCKILNVKSVRGRNMVKYVKMRLAVSLLLATLVHASANAGARFVVPSLPEAARPCAESETNVAFSTGAPYDNIWRLSLELDASASNCVEVVLGCDTDEDGVLGIDEVESEEWNDVKVGATREAAAWEDVPGEAQVTIKPEGLPVVSLTVPVGRAEDSRSAAAFSLQARIVDAAANGGGRVVVPAGGYLVDGPIRL